MFTTHLEILYQQTAAIQENINQQFLDRAEAKATAAVNSLYSYKIRREIDFLDSADNSSSEAIAFLSQKTDPFYIGGLIAAGWVRLSVLSVLQPNFGADDFRRNQVNQMVSALSKMIDTIKRQVDESHTVAGAPPGPLVPIPWRWDCFYHKHHGQIVEEFCWRESDPAPFMGPDLGYGSLDRAWAAAKDARSDGVKAELEFLQVPQSEKIRDQWNTLVEKSAAIVIPIFEKAARVVIDRHPEISSDSNKKREFINHFEHTLRVLTYAALVGDNTPADEYMAGLREYFIALGLGYIPPLMVEACQYLKANHNLQGRAAETLNSQLNYLISSYSRI